MRPFAPTGLKVPLAKIPEALADINKERAERAGHPMNQLFLRNVLPILIKIDLAADAATG